MLTLALALGCQATEPTEAEVPELPGFTDLDPDPDVVHVGLTATLATLAIAGAEPAEVWAYRDSAGAPCVPGPHLELTAGQELVVDFTNQLPESSTIHFHGPRLPNEMDGTLASQQVVQPGETFTYRFFVDDPQTFWYHPHVRTPVQVERGLYGSGVVLDPDGPTFDADRVFVLDDVLVDGGVLVTEERASDVAAGRQGNVVTVNGAPAGRTIASAGGLERWRLVNTAVARAFALGLEGADWTVLATDAGPVPQPWTADPLVLFPGDRLEVLVELSHAGAAELVDRGWDRGFGVPIEDERVLVQVQVQDQPEEPGALPTLAALPLLDEDPAGPVETLVLGEGVASTGEPVFTIDDAFWPFNTPLTGTVGDQATWSITNTTGGDHPFHLHGTFFQVLDLDGQAPEHPTLEDTVVVPRGSTVRLAVPYASPGPWMFHTHLLEHADRGMMGQLDLAE